MNWIRDHEIGLVFISVTALMIGLTVWAALAASSEFQENCEARGGRVIEDVDTSTGTGVNPSTGQPVVVTTTSTNRYCVTPDGGLIDVD